MRPISRPLDACQENRKPSILEGVPKLKSGPYGIPSTIEELNKNLAELIGATQQLAGKLEYVSDFPKPGVDKEPNPPEPSNLNAQLQRINFGLIFVTNSLHEMNERLLF